jgi:hypothetical protein
MFMEEIVWKKFVSCDTLGEGGLGFEEETKEIKLVCFFSSFQIKKNTHKFFFFFFKLNIIP